MTKRLVRVLLGLGMTLALVSTGSPAQAQSTVEVRYTGNATISPGLVAGAIRNVSWSFTSTSCVDVVGGTKKGPGTGTCSISGSGTATGACGSITGTGTIRITTHDGHLYTATVLIASTGGNLVYTLNPVTKVSNGQTGAGAGTAYASPDPATGGAQACLTAAGATKYNLLTGVATFTVV